MDYGCGHVSAVSSMMIMGLGIRDCSSLVLFVISCLLKFHSCRENVLVVCCHLLLTGIVTY